MKNIFFSLVLFCLITNCQGQSITGNWEGSLNVQGTSIPIIFHIYKDSTANYTATFDSPKQNAFNLACSNVIVVKDSVFLMMQLIKGKYSAKLNGAFDQLTGVWQQGSASLPLDMKRTSDVATEKKVNRPQTPKPPYPYKSEEVTYFNADKSIQFGATFTVPLPEPGVEYFRAPVYPTVILITGSGQQDRDETIFNHKPFAVMADYLTRQGIAVLRVDDRGIGKTSGNFSISTTADFEKDVETGIEYLKTRQDVDTGNIGLIGHSEGGMIAPMVAAERKDVKFIVLLAGPGVKISELMEQQNVDVMAGAGISKKDLDQFRLLYKELLALILKNNDTATAKHLAADAFKKWQEGKSASTVMNTTGVKDEKSMLIYINSLVAEFNKPWFNYFLKFNPADYLSKVNCPVLALNGEKDIQVAVIENLEAIQGVLAKTNNRKYKTKLMPGLNHLFQHCKTCTVNEYAELEETFDMETLKIISDWIKTDRFN